MSNLKFGEAIEALKCGNVISTWLPTVEDIFCDDWVIVD